MPFSLLQPLREIPIAFVDTETTGASAAFGHRVIELGIVRMERGVVVGEYQQLVDPQRRVGPAITALTGISQAMVDGQPTFAAQLPAAMTFLQGAIVVGHNIRFDLSFLDREFRRAGVAIADALNNVPVMDTVRIARRRFGRGGNGLQRLAPRLGIVPSVAHRALADAQTTAGVFKKLLQPTGGWDISLLDAIQQQGGPMGLLPANPSESQLPLELEEALEQKCAVMMEYLDARNFRTHRMISPLHIRRAGGELILIAHCHLRNDRRTFKVERIVRLRRPEEIPTASLPAAFPRDISQIQSSPISSTPQNPSGDAVLSALESFDTPCNVAPRPPGFADGDNEIHHSPSAVLADNAASSAGEGARGAVR